MLLYNYIFPCMINFIVQQCYWRSHIFVTVVHIIELEVISKRSFNKIKWSMVYTLNQLVISVIRNWRKSFRFKTSVCYLSLVLIVLYTCIAYLRTFW